MIKPVVGTYDLIITLIQGAKNSAKYEEHVMDIRTRPPRLFDSANLVIPYDWGTAMGKQVLRRLKHRQYEEHEKIHFYDEIELKAGRKKTKIYQVMVSETRFLIAHVSDMNFLYAGDISCSLNYIV